MGSRESFFPRERFEVLEWLVRVSERLFVRFSVLEKGSVKGVWYLCFDFDFDVLLLDLVLRAEFRNLLYFNTVFNT